MNSRARAFAAATAMLLDGCVGQTLLKYDPLPPAYALQAVGLPPIIDVRSSFRRILCETATRRAGFYPDERPCAEMIHDLGESDSSPPSIRTGTRPGDISILIVPGLFGECVAKWALPFSNGDYANSSRHPYDYLVAAGYREIVVAPISGRSSSEENAHVVGQTLAEMARVGHKKIVVLAYSKGVIDTLLALRGLSTDISRHIAAMVSIAGPINGSPIADAFDQTYRRLDYMIDLAACPRGEGDAVGSLRRDVRMKWLSENWNALPRNIAYYSLPAFDRPENITAALRPTYAALASVDPRNDGQVLYSDAVLPGSRLLGYAKSDHWAFVLPFNRSDHPAWRCLIDNNAFPREVLLEAVLDFVIREL